MKRIKYQIFIMDVSNKIIITILEIKLFMTVLCWANYLPAHIKSVTTNYSNDQLQFSLLKMGQVEILGRDRKKSVKRKKGAKERSISIGTKQHDNKSEQQAHNKIQHTGRRCCVLFNKTCILASTTTCTKLTKRKT